MKILGVDPGCRFAGYCLWQKGVGSRGQLVNAGCLKLDTTQSLACRLEQLYNFFSAFVVQHGVAMIALETPFLGKNAQNFLKLGYVRGILYLIAQQHGLIISELAPCEVKRAITGSGKASKEQVACALSHVVPQMRNIVVSEVRNDVTDAIAVGLAALWRLN